MKKVLFFALLILSLASCKKTSIDKNADVQSSYQIAVGENFKLHLPSNPSTGYSWQWDNKQLVSVLDTLSHHYDATQPRTVGGGGIETWTFKGVKQGVDSVKLFYRRPWEKTQVADKKIVFIVKVK
jgi:inhibitor of cysteine peptidase